MMLMFRLLLLGAIAAFVYADNTSSLAGKKICIDPGHGGTAATDSFRVGISGEREEWINLRVALLLKKMLEEKGATVIMTRDDDSKVDLEQRAQLAISNNSDLFVSIHHNATADRNVNFPIVYFHGAASENAASVDAAKNLAKELRKQLFNNISAVTVVSDYTIFPEKGAAVLRHSYGIPGLLAEASFFTNMEEEKRLKDNKYNMKEATAFFNAIEKYFTQSHEKVKDKKIPLQLPVFNVFQEAERMKPEALNWLNDYDTGKELYRKGDTASLRKAYDLFTRSAKSFPDSWVAKGCHEYRASILFRFNKKEESEQEKLRAAEFYVDE